MATVQKTPGVTVEVVGQKGGVGVVTPVANAAPGVTVEVVTPPPDPATRNTKAPVVEAESPQPREPVPAPPAPPKPAEDGKQVVVEGPEAPVDGRPPPGAEKKGALKRSGAAGTPTQAMPATVTASEHERTAFTKPPVRRHAVQPLGVRVVQVGGRQSVTVVNPGRPAATDPSDSQNRADAAKD